MVFNFNFVIYIEKSMIKLREPIGSELRKNMEKSIAMVELLKGLISFFRELLPLILVNNNCTTYWLLFSSFITLLFLVARTREQ